MISVVCVKHGTLYGPEYVNRLYCGVSGNLLSGFKGKFICYTDDPTGLDPAIEVRALPDDIEGWWNKLYPFSPGQFDEGERIVYIDLDTLIVGPLEEIFSYAGPFGIMRDFYNENGWQSSYMAWTPSPRLELIWLNWNEQGRPDLYGGDQAWIGHALGMTGADILQDKFPGAFVSYKQDCHPYPSEQARIVCFHGQPKPHNCGREWVEKMWRDETMAGFHLALERNTHLDVIRAQAKSSALRTNITRLKSQPANDLHVAIVGGGPSLPSQLDEIRWRRSIGQKIWALNGTHDWLIDHGITPDAMVLLDARRENVQFVMAPAFGVTYYLASQCAPEVYNLLWEERVVRYDIDQMGDCGTTVGTHAICVAFVEGYRQIHLYGFDSSYRGDDGHAYKQDLNARENIIDVQAGDRTFRAAPWMAQQAKDFISLAPDLVGLGCVITVHGDGLLPHVAKLMATPQIACVDIRASELLKRLNGAPALKGAEIGVFAGDMSKRLLLDERVELTMVDSWEGDGQAYSGSGEDWHRTLSQATQNAYAVKAARAVEFAGARAEIVRARSDEAAQFISDGSLDFVFIDADHSYEGCKRDIELWWPKVRAGGVVSGHDYENTEWPDFGVKKAVDEVAASVGQSVDRGEDYTWFLTRTQETLK